MFKCNDCEGNFDTAKTVTESRPIGAESYNVCPNCGGTNYEVLKEDEPYEPDLAEISKDIIKGIWYLNTFRYELEDLFGGAAENPHFEKGWDIFFEALHKITAPEGMDENVMEKIIDAKINESDLNAAIQTFLSGAGL